MLDNQRETLQLLGIFILSIKKRLKEYLNVVLLVDYLQDKYQNIILWGRSMGATNSLMYALKHQNIHCLILDSPFIDLEEIIINLIKDKLDTPNLINKGLFEIIKRRILQLFQFSISLVKIRQCQNINCPMLLLGSKFDNLISYYHFTKILDSYQGQKQIIHLYINIMNQDHKISFIQQQDSFNQLSYLLNIILKILLLQIYNHNDTLLLQSTLNKKQ